MGYILQEVEFPCGLKIKFEASSWSLTADFNVKEFVCPLHGKNCHRTRRK